ncbi:class I SAM-dependent methyltransferase [Siansivirga zeaxanthinifaciens]|uniref:SAM-dependent methyltransferase n=1 Tax=Siansivirga zeaxanthinifaciens CC-SAMT-1 TaxID=1454006 RepID=A0A0C5VVU1_9FLAO|nr:class I SAM-dependent methyltransferase [Siansivirga zeaxanthinifaciens]AJR03216.1 SAM-dependent methyltransferase [Siansivirga zeaxanthinifaciens CC-SAMT-1]
MEKKSKTPWPTKAVMEQIYNMHLWGGHTFDFYSGEGSHEPKIITPYIETVITFLKSHKKPLVVCDLGCGDFNIGKHLIKFTKTYIAIDIVDSLIKRNKKLFKADNLEFHCINIAIDELPNADCIILRQVLQHLSNAEIKSILKKIHYYKYIILTEHIPLGDFIPNKDIISGQGIRLKHDSGVDLLKPPFNLKINCAKQLTTYYLDRPNKSQIITILYELP